MKLILIAVLLIVNSNPQNSVFSEISNRACLPGEITDSEVWWVAGDAHTGPHSTGLTQAISDINQLNLSLNFAIQLGDNVNDRHEYKDLFMETMNTLESDAWDFVLGNHDFGRDNKAVFPVKYSGMTKFGIRFIFISDEVDGRINRDLIMNDDQKNWFFNELETHRDKPIFIFSHQPHDEFAHFDKLDFDRYNIIAWFHAHKHSWRIRGETEYGFHQLGVNAISGHLDPRQSSVLFMNTCNEKTEFLLKFRNHKTEKWIDINDKSEYYFVIE